MIWTTEWRCAAGHVVAASGWDEDAVDRATVEADAEAFGRDAGITPDCPICGGLVLIHHQPTGYRTMLEAMPHILDEQSRRLLASATETLDPRKAANLRRALKAHLS